MLLPVPRKLSLDLSHAVLKMLAERESSTLFTFCSAGVIHCFGIWRMGGVLDFKKTHKFQFNRY